METERHLLESQAENAGEREVYQLHLIPELFRLARDSRTIYLTGFNNPREQAVEALRMLGMEEAMHAQPSDEERETGGETT